MSRIVLGRIDGEPAASARWPPSCGRPASSTGYRGLSLAGVTRPPPAGGAAPYRGTMPEGDTITRTARDARRRPRRPGPDPFRRARASARVTPVRPGTTVDGRGGRRQALPRPLRRRAHAAHPHAHDRELAPLPAPGAVATDARGGAGRARGGAGRRLGGLGGGVLRGAGGRAHGRRPTRPSAHLGPDLCRPDADLDEAVRRFVPVRSRPRDRRGPARPDGQRRHRQRLQVRGALRLRPRPVHPGRPTSAPTGPGGCSPPPPGCSGPTSTPTSARPSSTAGSPSTAGPGGRAAAAGPSSCAGSTGRTTAAPTGAPIARCSP